MSQQSSITVEFVRFYGLLSRLHENRHYGILHANAKCKILQVAYVCTPCIYTTGGSARGHLPVNNVMTVNWPVSSGPESFLAKIESIMPI